MNKKHIFNKELYPILENESIQIGAFKANTLDIVKENIKFWKSLTGTSYPKNRLNERIITAPGHKTYNNARID